MTGSVFIRYLYFGRCSDGRYWFVQRNCLKYTYREGSRTVVRFFASIGKVLKDGYLFRSLPREVQQYLSRFREKVKTRIRNIMENIVHYVKRGDLASAFTALLEEDTYLIREYLIYEFDRIEIPIRLDIGED